MNLVKKGVIIGTTACLGITAYASISHGIGSVKALENASNNMSNLTENAQNLNNLEMSLNNLLLAANRINFISDNLISVSSDYMQTLQQDGLNSGSNLGYNSNSQNSLNRTSSTQNNAINGTSQTRSSTSNMNENQTSTQTARTRRNQYPDQIPTTTIGSNETTTLFFNGDVKNDIARLNTNATDVKNMLTSVNMSVASNMNFDDYTKALNMAADNLNAFSTMSLSRNSSDYPVSRRLALASIRISNQALEEIKAKINGNSTNNVRTNSMNNGSFNVNGINNTSNTNNNQNSQNLTTNVSNQTSSTSSTNGSNLTNMPNRSTTNFNR